MDETRSMERDIELLKGELFAATQALASAFNLISHLSESKLDNLIIRETEGLTFPMLKEDRKTGAETFRDRLVEAVHG